MSTMRLSDDVKAIIANDRPYSNTIREYIFDLYHEKNFFAK